MSKQLKSLKETERYEKYQIKYVKPASDHIYTPDFILSNGIIIEAKGLFQREDRMKHLLIQQQYPNLDIRFVFQNARTKLYKGSKTTYADWADKHGFTYAHKVIPDSWFHEEQKDVTGLIPHAKGEKKKSGIKIQKTKRNKKH